MKHGLSLISNVANLAARVASRMLEGNKTRAYWNKKVPRHD